MKIPHKVKIKPGVFYHVVWVDKFDDPNQLGWCDDGLGTKNKPSNGPKLIYLKKGMGIKEAHSIFIHEVLHAIEYEYKIKIPHSVVYALQEPLAHVLTRNPKSVLSGLLGTYKPAHAAKRKRKKRRGG